MFIVLFEVHPRQERWAEYVSLAGLLRPDLERIEGFIDNERFTSRSRPGWLLSLSTWRDEKALIRWRSFARHHAIQAAGRNGIFLDYHLRVGEITADSHVPKGQVLQEQRFDVTEIGQARTVAVTDGMSTPRDDAASGLVNWDAWESITQAGRRVLLESWHDRAPPDAQPGHRRRDVRVIREYGMRDRREAPQYHPPV